ncbi:MAG: RagB/SusD family nutrient uptake outer membrane protein [Gemmatimonadaceae bacterium]
MTSYMTTGSLRARVRTTATLGALVALGAGAMPMVSCSPGDYLEIQDPDIIYPEQIQSAAGANAMRIGALAGLNAATSGGESLFLLGGLFADEWINGDSFIARQEIDQRAITIENSFLTTANRNLHRARLAAEQALDLMTEWAPEAPAWQFAEMHLVQAYVINLMAEHYCDGIVISTIINGLPDFGSPMTVEAALERALAHADDGLALTFGTTANDNRVRHALRVTRGRILLNLDRVTDAAAAVAGVPTSFRYFMGHSQTSNSNTIWLLNNNARRYSVGNSEGTNGMNFATAADRRVPVCHGGDATCRANGVTRSVRDDLSSPYHVQLIWKLREDSVAIVDGIEARMIEAEAQLAAGDADAALALLNVARATVTGLAPLTDAGTPEARINQLFRERAFWFFSRGHRVGDLRRLIRQYGRTEDAVFPTGAWHKGGTYGNDVTVPIPQAELNNPNVQQSCMNRDASLAVRRSASLCRD